MCYLKPYLLIQTENGHQASDKTTGSVFKVPVKPDSSIHSHTENTEDVLKVVNECWTTPKQKKVECKLISLK